MQWLNDLVLHLAGSPWVLPLVGAFITLDAIFPPLPSESIVVALASLGVSTGAPSLVGLWVVTTLGALLGDNLAFALGRRLLGAGRPRHRWLQGRRITRSLEFARHHLDKRGAVLIISARYIPVGRVAVNLAAGASGMRWRRFALLTLVSGLTWSTWSIGIGALAGHWFQANPLLGAVIAVVVAVVLGVIVDRILQWRLRTAAPVDDQFCTR